jgi:hypothetical protein
MGVLKVAQLDPPWDTTAYRNLLLNLLSQSWGAYTLFHGASIDNQYAEFANVDGAKHFVDFRSSTQMFVNVASDVTVATRSDGVTSYNTYNNPISTLGANLYNTNFSGSATVFMASITSAQYKLFMALSGTATAFGGVGLLQRVPSFWGTNKRIWLYGTNHFSGNLLPGENPWGTYSATEKRATVIGLTAVNARLDTLPTAANALLSRRQITKNHSCSNEQAVIGYLPDDFAFMAASGINPMTKYADEAAVEYVMLLNGMGVQLDAAV